MARLTRPENQALTRERLLATAKSLFLSDGYHPTSIEKVADAAGYSKGAVYSNFSSKDELCMAVLDSIRRDETEVLLSALAQVHTLESRIDALQTWADQRIGDGQWTSLELEFSAHARRDPALRAVLARRNAAMMRACAHLIALQIAEMPTKPAMSAEAIASATVSLAIGLGFQRSIDPSISINSFMQTYRTLLTGNPQNNNQQTRQRHTIDHTP